MQHLFTKEGEAALEATLRRKPLLAFDFDGTLAPIVPRPADARVTRGVAARLRGLAARLPVAIVTGRSVEDVRQRLGFRPSYIVGSHGAEDGADLAGTAARARVLDRVREVLAAHRAEWAAAGVTVEDKAQSIALHYRLAPEPERARALILALLMPPDASVRVFAGKMVVNVVAADAPDKAGAVQSLLARCGADAMLFAGDDVNDEPVFALAGPTWLTVRIGRDDPTSRARYYLDSPREMVPLLDRVRALLSAQQAA